MQTIASLRFYVYVLCRPNGRPFYVGKGSGKRLNYHEKEARSGHRCHKCNIIRKIWRAGGEVHRYILLETNDEQEAFAYECDLIALHGRDNLCNLTDGGEGAADPSPEIVAKRRRSQLKAWSNAPERREKVRAAMERRYSDQAAHDRISEQMKARWADPEARARMSQTISAFYAVPEHRARRSVVSKALLADPDRRAAFLAASLAHQQTPAARANQSARAKALWADPEYRARVSAKVKEARSDPAKAEQRSAAIKAGWETRRKKKEGNA